jgi:hypothetical protein
MGKLRQREVKKLALDHRNRKKKKEKPEFKFRQSTLGVSIIH